LSATGLYRPVTPSPYNLGFINTQLTRTCHGPRHRALRTRIKAFIDEHLTDPRLSPEMVADAHNVSIRTLHRLFQDEPSMVAELIRTVGLHRCKRDLVLLERSISAVVGHWGFPNKAHFSRVFRLQFGMSPQAYREQARHPRAGDHRPLHASPHQAQPR
jgi:AraC-like DNA-binding protein